MTTGYHTVEDRGNPDYIEMEAPFLCERDDAWLGHGYYFWDTNITWAHEWGNGNMNRVRNPWLDGYVICKAAIENAPEIMFDLVGNVEHQLEFEAMIELLEADESYHRERPVVAEILQFMNDQGFFTYKSVRAADYPPKKIVEVDFRPSKGGQAPQRPPFMIIGQRFQVCLFEKSAVTLRDFSIIFPSNYQK